MDHRQCVAIRVVRWAVWLGATRGRTSFVYGLHPDGRAHTEDRHGIGYADQRVDVEQHAQQAPRYDAKDRPRH